MEVWSCFYAFQAKTAFLHDHAIVDTLTMFDRCALGRMYYPTRFSGNALFSLPFRSWSIRVLSWGFMFVRGVTRVSIRALLEWAKVWITRVSFCVTRVSCVLRWIWRTPGKGVTRVTWCVTRVSRVSLEWCRPVTRVKALFWAGVYKYPHPTLSFLSPHFRFSLTQIGAKRVPAALHCSHFVPRGKITYLISLFHPFHVVSFGFML